MPNQLHIHPIVIVPAQVIQRDPCDDILGVRMALDVAPAADHAVLFGVGEGKHKLVGQGGFVGKYLRQMEQNSHPGTIVIRPLDGGWRLVVVGNDQDLPV